MEKNKLLQILIPTLAGAAILAIVLFLVLKEDPDRLTRATEKNKDGRPVNTVVTPERQRCQDASADKMSQAMPPLTGNEFRDLGKGLRAHDVVEGDGDPCEAGATVTIHYAGWLLTTGTRFDSSYIEKIGSVVKPMSWPLGQLVQGWQLGIPGMKPGGIRRLIIPPELGYGQRGMGNAIPGGATLVFEIKLIEWK